MESEHQEVFIPYRKHSSGDLQSRLKTRKILGVGETDNGDIHRSKISQVLGHNEHLYVKFPRCYSAWHLIIAILYTSTGLMNLLMPENVPQTSMETSQIIHSNNLVNRFYGSSILGCAMLLWALWQTTDKGLARVLMSAVATSEMLHFAVLCSHIWYSGMEENSGKMHIVIHLIALIGSGYFFLAIGSSTAGLRKTPSYKDLRDPSLQDGNLDPETFQPTETKKEN